MIYHHLLLDATFNWCIWTPVKLPGPAIIIIHHNSCWPIKLITTSIFPVSNHKNFMTKLSYVPVRHRICIKLLMSWKIHKSVNLPQSVSLGQVHMNFVDYLNNRSPNLNYCFSCISVQRLLTHSLPNLNYMKSFLLPFIV